MHRRTLRRAALAAACAVAAAVTPAAALAPAVDADPATTLVRRAVQVLGGEPALGSMTFTLTAREVEAYGQVSATTLRLPFRGTYAVQSCVDSVPAAASNGPVCVRKDVRLRGAARVTVPATSATAYRPLDRAAVQVRGWVDVYRLTANRTWRLYASARSPRWPSLPLERVGAVHDQLRGANVYLFRSDWTPERVARQLDALAAAGADVVKTAIPWPQLQPRHTPGFDPTVVAEVSDFLDQAHRRGLKVVATFGSSPCWASTAPPAVKGNCTSTTAWGRYPPQPDALATAARLFARTFGDRLAAVQVWNEPNQRRYFTGTPADYVAVLDTVYAGIKQVTPSLPVLGGSMAFADVAFLQKLYAAGVAGHWDGLAVHPYNWRMGPTDQGAGDPRTPWPDADATYSTGQGVPLLHRVMAEHGEGAKKVWIDEVGFTECAYATALCVTERQQADWDSATLRMAARWPYVAAVTIEGTKDVAAHAGSWREGFGLLTADERPKPAYYAFARTLACLEARTC